MSAHLVTQLVVAAAAIAAGCIDARTGRIPNALTTALAVAAFALAAWQGAVAAAGWGALVTGGPLWLLHALTRGRGIGLGDVKLAVGIGAALGVAGGVIAFGAAFVGGAVYALSLLVRRRARRGEPIPFGPFIAAGTLATVLFGVNP